MLSPVAPEHIADDQSPKGAAGAAAAPRERLLRKEC